MSVDATLVASVMAVIFVSAAKDATGKHHKSVSANAGLISMQSFVRFIFGAPFKLSFI
jgi:hypothetical protein